MVVTKHDYSDEVKFISYTGKYPNLCVGVLTLEIEQNTVTFGYEMEGWKTINAGMYDKFWDSSNKGYWITYYEELPEEYKKYAYEIDKVMNDHIEKPCCGGCE